MCFDNSNVHAIADNSLDGSTTIVRDRPDELLAWLM
jgi:hypothetical protein